MSLLKAGGGDDRNRLRSNSRYSSQASILVHMGLVRGLARAKNLMKLLNKS